MMLRKVPCGMAPVCPGIGTVLLAQRITYASRPLVDLSHSCPRAEAVANARSTSTVLTFRGKRAI